MWAALVPLHHNLVYSLVFTLAFFLPRLLLVLEPGLLYLGL